MGLIGGRAGDQTEGHVLHFVLYGLYRTAHCSWLNVLSALVFVIDKILHQRETRSGFVVFDPYF